MATTILHALEPMATGVLYSTSRICHLLGDEFTFHVLHGIREETPPDYRRYFPKGTGLTPWQVSRELHPKRDAKALRELRRAVADVKPDIIHAHSSKAGGLARIAYPRKGPPVIYSPRGFSFLRRDISRLRRRFYRSAECLLARGHTLTVACGLGEYREAIGVGGRALVIPNMVDVPIVGQSRAGRRGNRLRMAMVGGIRPQKNFPLFCAIASHPRMAEVAFTWFGGGEVPDGVDVPKNVEVTGWLPRRDVLAGLAECDAFVQTSLWEGLPIGVLEAMALGLPILAVPCVGNTELVVEGENGYLCTTADAFVERIDALRRDPELLASFGDRSRDIVFHNHTPERVVDRWRSLYRHPERYLVHG